MTLNDLIKQVPEDLRDCFIRIYIPILRDGDQGNYPLIQIEFDQLENGITEIILEADV